MSKNMPICIGLEEELEKKKEEWRERKRRWKKLNFLDQLIVFESVLAIIFVMIIVLLVTYAGIKAALDVIFNGDPVSLILSFILLAIELCLVAIVIKLMKIVQDKLES